MSRSRRSALHALALVGLTGCVGAPEAGSASSPSTPSDCEPTTAFEPPQVEKPAPLDADSAVDVAARIEYAYQSAIEFSPPDAPGIPDDAGPYDYSLSRELSETYSREDGFTASLTAMVGYTATRSGENGSTTAIAYDQPVTVATYVVTDTRVIRESGVGDLTGTVLCW